MESPPVANTGIGYSFSRNVLLLFLLLANYTRYISLNILRY